MRKLFIFLFGIVYTINSYSEENIKLLLAGDTMLGSNKTYMSPKLFGDSIKQLSNNYNIIFFNFEGTIGNIGKDNTNPKCSCGKYCFTFMSPQESPILLNDIKNKDTNIVFNMANNHSLDYGSNIQQQTYNILSKYGYPIGYVKSPVQEMTIDNQKIVFIGASPHNGSLSIFSKKLPLLVKEYKSKNYIVIISLHMGVEGNNEYWVKSRY